MRYLQLNMSTSQKTIHFIQIHIYVSFQRSFSKHESYSENWWRSLESMPRAVAYYLRFCWESGVPADKVNLLFIRCE